MWFQMQTGLGEAIVVLLHLSEIAYPVFYLNISGFLWLTGLPNDPRGDQQTRFIIIVLYDFVTQSKREEKKNRSENENNCYENN